VSGSTILIPDEPEQGAGIVALLDVFSRTMFGTTRKQAHQENRCIICRTVITREMFAAWSPTGRDEYAISGVCESCFDTFCADGMNEEGA
jgi:hypothetical protein